MASKQQYFYIVVIGMLIFYFQSICSNKNGIYSNLVELSFTFKKGNSFVSKVCTGALIDEDIVVTAKHCFDGDFQELLVGIGVRDRADTALEKRYNISLNHIIHHNEADLSVILISYEKHECSANWYNIREHIEMGQNVTVLGYGCDNSLICNSTHRHPSNSPKILSESIFKINNNTLNIKADNISDYVCVGDSGGPVVARDNLNDLIGIVIGGLENKPCSETTQIIKLSSYKDWIIESSFRLRLKKISKQLDAQSIREQVDNCEHTNLHTVILLYVILILLLIVLVSIGVFLIYYYRKKL